MEQQTEASLPQGWKVVAKRSIEVAQVNQSSPDNMIAAALQAGRPMEDIGIMINHRNDEIARLAKLDFFEAKRDFLKLRKRIVKSREADFGENKEGKKGAKYKYEDLDAVDEAIRDACAEVGLSWDWKTTYEGNWIYVTCILSHTSGHSESDQMREEMDKSGGKSNIQASASTITYLRRYTLKAVLGLSSGKDDNDGHPVVKPNPEDVNILKAPSAEKFQEILKMLIRKKVTLDELQARNHFTADQLKAIADLNLPAND